MNGVAFMLGLAWTIVGLGLAIRGIKWFSYSRGVFERLQCIVDLGLGIFLFFISIVFCFMAIGVI